MLDEETTAAGSSSGGCNARTVDPMLKRRRQGLDVENDFELYNPEDTEYRDSKKWTSYQN
jgi:hypothetical protein